MVLVGHRQFPAYLGGQKVGAKKQAPSTRREGGAAEREANHAALLFIGFFCVAARRDRHALRGNRQRGGDQQAATNHLLGEIWCEILITENQLHNPSFYAVRSNRQCRRAPARCGPGYPMLYQKHPASAHFYNMWGALYPVLDICWNVRL